MSGTREENVFMARLAEQAERYEDMVIYMNRVVDMASTLSLDERNLLSVAYKNSVGVRRQSCRLVVQMEREPGHEASVRQAITAYRSKVEEELTARCNECLNVLNRLIPSETAAEPKVFYLKMKADYYRYLAEFQTGEEHRLKAQEAHTCYSEASEVAKELEPIHPVRLGLALNFSVFYYEVVSDAQAAGRLAKAAFDEAVEAMHNVDETTLDDGLHDGLQPSTSYKDSLSIVHLLRDNLALWSSNSSTDIIDGTAVEEM